MEYIDRLFYRKINPSDFKKLYDIDRPEGGGGQTYLEAAGIPNEDIVDFLSYAEISDSPLKDELRSIYTFNAYVLGNSSKSAFLEFAPRGGRNNYRISRQNMKYKHPAWSLENGFPEPNKDANGEYTSEGNFDGIIDNLIIMILRTTHRKYYAGYVNSANMPVEWPTGIGLERIFEGERRGVLNLSHANVEFKDSCTEPFGKSTPDAREGNGTNTLLYGVPGSGKSWTIEHEYCKPGTIVERLVFHPDYTNADFVGQILPVVDPVDKQVTYEFTPGPFTNILRAAYLNPCQKYVLIIEEINRGKSVIEDMDGYRIFYLNGKPIRRENDLQIMYRLVWYATEYDVNREVNNGRGPVDFKVSKGSKDSTLVEFKLASNTKLRKNLENQVEIYKRANCTNRAIKVILYFTEEEYAKVTGILNDLKLHECDDIVLINAIDNKPSASTVG